MQRSNNQKQNDKSLKAKCLIKFWKLIKLGGSKVVVYIFKKII